MISALPYLDAVIKETLRLYTAIPGTLPRVIPADSSQGKFIDGVYLPAGTVVGTFAYGIHRDLSVFGSNNFDPERWLSGRSHEKQSNEEEVETKRVKDMEKRLWAFGSGSRACVGRKFSE